MTLQQVGDTVTMRPVIDPAEEERKLTQPIGQLRDIRKDVPRPVSDPGGGSIDRVSRTTRPPMFLIDTNIAIHLRDGHREMTARVNALPRRPAVSLTARMEREGGVYRHPAFADARRAAVDAVVGMFEVEPVDGAVIAAYGRIVVACGLSRRKITTGRPPPPRWWAT